MKTVLIFLDGVSPDVLETMAKLIGSESFFYNYFISKNGLIHLPSVFPSVTPPALSTILSGRYPFETGVYNFAYLDDSNYLINLMSICNFLKFTKNNRKNTLFYRLSKAGIRILQVNCYWDINASKSIKTYTPYKWSKLLRILKKQINDYDILFIEDRRIDSAFHKYGISCDQTLDIFVKVDRFYYKLFDVIAKAYGEKNIAMILFSDHGNESTTKLFKISDLIESRFDNSLCGCKINKNSLVLHNMLNYGRIRNSLDLLHTGAGGGQKTFYFPKLRSQIYGRRLCYRDFEHILERILPLKCDGQNAIEMMMFVEKETSEHIYFGIIYCDERTIIRYDKREINSPKIVKKSQRLILEINNYPNFYFNVAQSLWTKQGGDFILTSKPSICFDQATYRNSIHGGLRKAQIMCFVSYYNFGHIPVKPLISDILRPIRNLVVTE